MMPRKKWTSDKPHRLRVRTPKWVPLMDDMIQVLTTYGHPATTSQLYDLWWDWEVERRVQQDIADGGPGRRNKSPFHTPTRRELSGWLKRDGRFLNINTSLRNTGKVALWVVSE